MCMHTRMCAFVLKVGILFVCVHVCVFVYLSVLILCMPVCIYPGMCVPLYVLRVLVAGWLDCDSVIQGNLSKTATRGPVLTGLYKEVVALQR